MAKLEQVERLKQSVAGWNAWRKENPGVQPDLSQTDLRDTNLSGANLRDTNLSGAILSGVDLRDADLSGANLRGVDLRDAHLSGISLNETDPYGSDLIGADLSRANMSSIDLSSIDLSGANLSGANLSNSYLSQVDLSRANLNETDLSGVYLSASTLAKINLRTTKGLTTIKHVGASHIELFSVQLPQDGSALHFLRGVGVSDEWIDYYCANMMHTIQYHSVFISYSSQDETLARRLYADLQASGVRCWFAPEDLKIGNKFRQHIDEAIHQQDKLLLLLSEHSIASTWVENEVEAAVEKEDRQQRDVLFPVSLDDVVMQTPKAWAATLRRTRHIGDFTNWIDSQAYQSAFDRLLRDLKQS